MSQVPADPVVFEGEEAGSGYASPKLDLIATVFLVALSVVVMVASVNLPVPGDLRTAPGLLPFMTAASLCVMALFLGLTALKRHRAGTYVAPIEDRTFDENLRVLALASAIACYIGALHFLAFQYGFTVGGAYFTLSAFEPATMIALAAIIQVSWRGPVWITTIISVGWTLVLSVVFQKVFAIPLPGGF
ncbi:tripartite tricarboxylate transporter TctB family protein [Phaeobacter marinintestinus]|uniref:tripartite tricarboxylate transporter TctB family protein n=1 Tax=Falsiphaeobacter marinintestinus TaxID=1492905 RepID=UPI0011B7BEFA|nr:tripartite tricarboxylate transporter TctB family protein [Phaeobacter marinintestinus]